MAIYLLLIILIGLFVISYFANNRNLMSPSILLIAGYIISTATCIFNISYWGVNLSFFTVAFITFGIISFLAGEFFCKKIFLQKKVKLNTRNAESSEQITIHINNNWIYFFVFLNFIIIILTFNDILKVSDSTSGLSGMLNNFRNELNYGNSNPVSSLVIQLRKITKPAAFIFLFVFVSKLYHREKCFFYLLPTLLHGVATLLTGGRIELIALMSAGLFFYYLQLIWSHTKNKNFKFFLVVFASGTIFLILFYFLKFFLGRKGDENIIQYISKYAGGSIYLLDDYLSNPASGLVSETFPGLIESFYKLGLINLNVSKSLEFRASVTGIAIGNVYTGLRRFYADFGIIGVFVLQFIYSFILNFIYLKLFCNMKRKKTFLFMLILYGELLYTILIQAIEDAFFINISIGWILELVLAYVICRVVQVRSVVKGVKYA